jgi:Ca2+-binding EF-hand superfamily protein
MLALVLLAASDAVEPALKKADMPRVMHPHLVDNEIAAIRADTTALHDLLDKNKDAELTIEELIPLFKRHEISKRALEIDRLREQYSSEGEQQSALGALKAKGIVSTPPMSRGDLVIAAANEQERGSGAHKRALLANLKFDIYDEDSDGLLQTDEFIDYLMISSRYVELHEEIAMDVRKYSQLFVELDTNKDAAVELDEADKGSLHPTGRQNLAMLFDICDEDQDGRLVASEFYCYEGEY